MTQHKIVEKGYNLDSSKVAEPWQYGDVFVLANDRNKAKQKLLHHLRHDDVRDKETGEEYNYLTIPVLRAKWYDLVEFEGRQIKRHDADKILFERNRKEELQALLNDPEKQHCYILKHSSYYRPNSAGYTDKKTYAGLYTVKEGVSHAMGCSDLHLVFTSAVEHDTRINREIEILQSNKSSNN